MSDLRGLIERCEKATGPDRGIDAALFALDDPMLAISAPWPTWIAKQELGLDDFKAIYPYTRSVDAALALVEKMRPGWSVQIYAHPGAAYVTLYQLGDLAHFPDGKIERRVTSPYFEAQRHDDGNVAMAVVAALLRSLDSQGVGE